MFTGDFGHHVIGCHTESFDCICGKKGCFEVQASAQGLVRHYKKLIHNGKHPTVCNAETIMKLYRYNDAIAKQAFIDYREDLSTGLANLVTFYNPDVIALGGGLSQAAELFEG